MSDINIKELEYNLKGIDLSFESINDLIKLHDGIKSSRFILVPSPIIKTVNIALEGAYRRNKLKGYESISLENNEDNTIFDKILATIKAIWKKIIETWDYIWNKITDFFNISTVNDKLEDQKIEKSEIQLKELSVMLKDKDIPKEEIKLKSLTAPLDYLNKEITENDFISLLEDLPKIDKKFSNHLKILENSYKIALHTMTEYNLKNKSIEEIDELLYKHFFIVLKDINKLYDRLDSDDVDILESLISNSGVSNTKINVEESGVIKGFVKGGRVYFYLIESKENNDLKLFECLAVDKVSDEGSSCKLYYLDLNTLESLSSKIKVMTFNSRKLMMDHNQSYKNIKSTHNSVRKEIDKLINDPSVRSEESPEDFRHKFETLKNISHSMLRYALELSKGLNMYRESCVYYRKLYYVNLDYYNKLKA